MLAWMFPMFPWSTNFINKVSTEYIIHGILAASFRFAADIIVKIKLIWRGDALQILRLNIRIDFKFTWF